ncbi:hypothetical protein PRZ48_006989 [Zasmidium cellare]|uniref:AB hydrolase-1 domain-containing protein n=1 Tax=Zasmidium cellare TaxID=395010 RepID=A0ABR0EJ13_ZASCE|nr:hypothetical protein PRZ48_006989 [Zasmidium cellare]
MIPSTFLYLAVAALLPLTCRAEGSAGTGPLDQSFFTDYTHRIATISTDPETVRIGYVDAAPASNGTSRGTILIIHGWPSSSYGFHKVIPLFMQAGYRVIAPDYRGAGNSNRPLSLDGYRKSVMAADLHTLVQNHLNISEPINVVGHDIGAMVSVAYAGNFPTDTASLVWSESEVSVPGSAWYEQTKNSPTLWHFNFHRVPDLVETLTKGRVREYIKIFYDSFLVNPAGINPAERDYIASQYEEPGGMRAAAHLYRTFDDDAREN